MGDTEWEKIYALSHAENADELLMWINTQLVAHSNAGFNFHGLADKAASNAIRAQDVQKTAEGWAEAACKLYDLLAASDQSADQSSAFSFMRSAMFVRAGLIQAYGHQDRHVVRDRNLLLNWFFKQVHSTPEQTLMLSVGSKTALSNSPSFTKQAVDQLRYLRLLRNALAPLQYCASSFEHHAELQKWLSLRGELP